MNKCPQCGRNIPYEGLCNKCTIENEENAILALDEKELEAKTAEVISDGFKEDLCRLLIRLRGINTEKLADYAWEHQKLDCPEVYKDASDKVVNEMIAELQKDDTECGTASRILRSLSHKGGDTVRRAFIELEHDPRGWRKELFADPSLYANEGGWTYNKDGGIIKTAFDKCFPIIKGTPEQRAASPVKLVTKTDGVCPDCGCRYLNIIEIDGQDERLNFLGIDGKLAVKICPNCAPFADEALCRYELDGTSEVIPTKSYGTPIDDDSFIDRVTDNTFVLGEQANSVYFPCDWDTGSAVGGRAFWIQDCIIRNCPDCGKPMMYLAQIGEEPLGFEGNFYVEVCGDCKIAAVLYQQT